MASNSKTAGGRISPQWNLSSQVPAHFVRGPASGGHTGPAKPSVRFSPADVSANLGLLADLAGSWAGEGFNLIARPAFHYQQDLYLQLNKTRETLKFDPIGSSIPNRGFGQEDIELFGLTYLQKITDFHTGGALHIEPGIWVRQPDTISPQESAPPGAQLVARMGSIPHGNAILVQGVAEHFSGSPTLALPGSAPHGSRFLSFNSTPIAAPPTVPANLPPVFSAATSSAKGTSIANPGVVPLFNEYDLSVAEGPANPRTPLDTSPAEPPFLNTPDNQAIVDDPITVLQKVIDEQVKDGYSFEGTVLNIATQTTIDFFTAPDSPVAGPTVSATLPSFNGGAENILFLFDDQPPPPPTGNAQTAIIYATFWIEKVTHRHHGHSFMQLQYAQMVTLNFPVHSLLPNVFVNLGWPHITVATLRKGFG